MSWSSKCGLLFAAMWFVLFSGPSWAQPASPNNGILQKHTAKGVACAACHKEAAPRKAPAKPNDACASCHGTQDALAAKTAQAHPNPHAPPHLAPGEKQACNDCHRVHKPSSVACAECHRGFVFNVK